jgi:paraquat-inducible protein B
MAENPGGPDLADLPQAKVAEKRRSKFSLVWIVPLVAVLIGAWLAWHTYSQIGPAFVITFKTADGIEPGKTKIKYRSVDVGTVENVELAPDRATVIVHARMAKYASDYLVDDTRFWVVRPRIAGGNVQGLGTLLSGSYLGMNVGKSTKERREFTGLEDQPVVGTDIPGRQFVLTSETAGSVSVGSPVFFRRFQVGEVESTELDKNGTGVTTRIFVQSPYDKYVTEYTRFWEASGFDVSLSASGLQVDTESLASILIGGIAFQARPDAPLADPVGKDRVFKLYQRRDLALALEETSVVPLQLRFTESVRGLTVGAPVDFLGLTIGEVTGIRVDLAQNRSQLFVVVLIDVYPERLWRQRIPSTKAQREPMREGIDGLVKNGLRAQLKTGSLLTGQRYVSLDFYRNAKPAQVAWNAEPPEFPTVPGSLTGLEENIATISAKLAKVPYEEIGQDLRNALASLNTSLQTIDGMAKGINRDVTPELKQALVDVQKSLTVINSTLSQESSLQTDVRGTLQEISRAAASLRVLTDYLEQHPEALIRGKPKEKQ